MRCRILYLKIGEKTASYYFNKPSKNGVSIAWDGILFVFGIWLNPYRGKYSNLEASKFE